MRITLHIATKNRHSELALLLQSLRTQTYQKFDLIILDDASGSPIGSNYFISHLLNRLMLEDHGVKVVREEKSFGVCHARNKCLIEDDFENELVGRIDDDCILESDYLEKMVHGIIMGFDIMSGVTPFIGQPILKRDIKFIGSIINKKIFNKKGEIIKYGDDCGYGYVQEAVFSAHEFRSNAIMKRAVVDKIGYETNLTPVGFREEGFFSLRALYAGFKIGVNTHAIAWHLMCPSGGVRNDNYRNCVALDNETFYKFAKKMYLKYGELPK